ncbi:MAG: hypothetical protein AAGA46_03195 [Cyanobacteria bacterium P01_F01_bin.13]
MSITLAELRNRVSTALSAELGTKTFATSGGDQTVAALTVDDGSVPVTSGVPWVQKPKKHTGLEVVIEPEIDSNIRPLLGGDFYLTHVTRITLKQWDITKTTMTGRSLLIQELGNLINVVGPRIGRNTTLDTIEQQSFDIIQYASS